jgi:hypothetical protein
MLLNASTWDFHVDGEEGMAELQSRECSSVSPKPRPLVPCRSLLAPLEAAEELSTPGTTKVVNAGPKQIFDCTEVPRYLPFSPFSTSETYLWTYFDRYITPQCVLNPDFNPYRDIVLRITEGSRDGPLFQCVLAAAANQLHSVGFAEYKPVMWLHRAKALHLLRMELESISV